MALEVIRDGRRPPRRFRRASVALGNFDGVHLGHQALFTRVRDQAAREGGEAVVYTFEPHPVAFFFPDRAPFQLTTLEQRLELIEASGIAIAVVATFDASYAAQTPEAFAREILVGRLGARAVVVGYDFTFGKGRAGTPEVLVSLGRAHGFEVDVIAPVAVDGEPVSSSRIRKALAAGDVGTAARLLGRPYAIRGTVVEGRGRGGAALGFPTANLASENPILPPNGVYAGRAKVLGAAGRREPAGERQAPPPSSPPRSGGECTTLKDSGGGVSNVSTPAYPAAAPHLAAINIGVAPTFEAGAPRIVEAHLLDFEGDLYGRRIEVAFEARVRDERRFPSLDALKTQIAADVAAVRAALAQPPEQGEGGERGSPPRSGGEIA